LGDAGQVLFIFQDLQRVIRIVEFICFLEVLHSFNEFPMLNGIVVVLIGESHNLKNFCGINILLSHQSKSHEFVSAQFVIPILIKEPKKCFKVIVVVG